MLKLIAKFDNPFPKYSFPIVPRSITTNWLKYLPVVGNVFWLIDDATKTILQKLKDVENAARQRGDAVETVVAALAARLSDESTRNVYYSSKEPL